VLLREGAEGGMNDESLLKQMRDFDVQVVRGNRVVTYRGANWARIGIRSTLDQVVLDADITIPGYAAP
jgi:uncharacterized protein YheU (UPF0270 family)